MPELLALKENQTNLVNAMEQFRDAIRDYIIPLWSDFIVDVVVLSKTLGLVDKRWTWLWHWNKWTLQRYIWPYGSDSRHAAYSYDAVCIGPLEVRRWRVWP